VKVMGLRPNMVKGLCRSCKAPIVWAVTAKGEKMRVDEQQVLPGVGNLVLWFEVDGLGNPVDPPTQRVMTATAEQRASGPVWLSHFATCPRAGAWRKSEASK
jgi:hypothetical protein